MTRAPTAATPSASLAHAGESRETRGTTGRLFGYASRPMIHHGLLCTGSFLLYLLLNRPNIMLLSKLGTAAWFPAAGFSFAIMFGVSPWYMPVFAVANGLSGILIYHQPFVAWGTLVGAPLETAVYAYAAHLLRGHAKIDSTLGERHDVLRYVVLTSVSAVLSGVVGALCLYADHTISLDQLWSAGLVWFLGDAVGIFSVGPFLLIYVLPGINNWITAAAIKAARQRGEEKKETASSQVLETLEFVMQGASLLVILCLMFGRTEPLRLDYLAFLPIIWIAMRHGIRGVVSGLLALNFGIALSLRLVPSSPELSTKMGVLMVAFSATGLILGSSVTERQSIADELKERTAFLKSLIGNSPFAIVAQDLQTGINLVNDAFLELFQFNALDVIGRRVDELIVPADALSQHKELVMALNSGRPVHVTTRRMRKDGRTVDVELHALPLFKNGQVRAGYAIYKSPMR
jgi:PAS domain S-box-containing protein